MSGWLRIFLHLLMQKFVSFEAKVCFKWCKKNCIFWCKSLHLLRQKFSSFGYNFTSLNQKFASFEAKVCIIDAKVYIIEAKVCILKASVSIYQEKYPIFKVIQFSSNKLIFNYFFPSHPNLQFYNSITPELQTEESALEIYTKNNNNKFHHCLLFFSVIISLLISFYTKGSTWGLPIPPHTPFWETWTIDFYTMNTRMMAIRTNIETVAWLHSLFDVCCNNVDGLRTSLLLSSSIEFSFASSSFVSLLGRGEVQNESGGRYGFVITAGVTDICFLLKSGMQKRLKLKLKKILKYQAIVWVEMDLI